MDSILLRNIGSRWDCSHLVSCFVVVVNVVSEWAGEGILCVC